MNVNANKVGFRTRAAALCAGLLVTLGVSGLAGPASHAAPASLGATAAAATGPLTVDLGASTGAFRGGASGSLYGLSADGVPSDNLIQGMGLQTTDTKAQDGQQHPGSDALEVVKPFLRNGGRDLFIYMTDQYRDFPYERKSYAEYQGYMRTQVEQALTSPDRDRIVFVPYNEPDINWFSGLTGNATTRAAYQNEWLQTYQLIKGIWPQARIAGPNLTGYYPTTFNSFFTFCKANGCLPDVVTWHYALNVPTPVRSDVAAYRALERQLGIGPLPVNLNEYGARYQLTNPAQMVGWLSALEDAKVDGDMSYWNINGTLSDSTAQQNVPNAQWWLYNWYSQLTGQTVAVTPSPGDAMQGLATLDPAKRQARVIVGGGPPGATDVVVKHVDPAVFGSTVHATVERDRWTGVVGAAAQPVRVADTDVPVGADGSITLPIVDDTDQVVTGACDATGARVPGRLGNALRLCGNNEYAQLPQGIVGGLNDFTISTWVNPSANTQWSRLFDFGSGTNTNMFVTMNDGTNLRFAITTGGGGGEQRINANGVLPLNTWSHIAVTLSGNTGTLYVNGHAVGTNPDMTLHPSGLGDTTQNYIGKSQYNDPYLNGMVDDFQIYGQALSASDIAALATGQPGAGDVADYRFDEASGATATDSSGNGHDATIVSAPQRASSTSAYQIMLSPGGTGSSAPVDATWTQGYEAEAATLTGSGWNINTEGTSGNLGGFATSNNQDVGGLRTGSSTVITFHTDVPQAGDYDLAIFDGSYPHASDVSGPTNVFVRVDGGAPHEVDLPLGYEWPVWTHADTMLHLSAGKHDISLSTVGADGAATNGDAIIDKIDLRLLSSTATLYEAEQAALSGATVDYRRQGQSGAGSVDLRHGQSATFWVYSARDGYSDLLFRTKPAGLAHITVNGAPVAAVPHGTDHGWLDAGARPYLSGGVNKIVVSGDIGRVTLDELTVTPASGPATTYPAEDGTLTGTARVDSSYSQAHAGVVTGVGGGPANSLTFHVRAARPGRYAMTVRFANGEELTATHYNPDVMTAPADISVSGGPTTHVNFGNTFHWNQFWNLTIPLQLHAGANTIRFIANPQYDYDGTTIGVVYSGSGPIGGALRSDTAPNIDEITIARWQR